MIKKVLGFDISSSTIGYALLEVNLDTGDIKFIECKYYKPIKKGSIIERLIKTRDDIKSIISNYKPDYIGIEDIIEFMKNKSQAKTIITLALFNRTISLVAYDYLGHAPELFNVLAIRHGLKENSKFPKKEDMPELVARHLMIKFPYEYKKNKKNIKEESCDMADGVAVSLFYSFILCGRIKRKIKIKTKRKRKEKVE